MTIPDGEGGTMPATGWNRSLGDVPEVKRIVTECKPKVITGKVVRQQESVTGTPLVYVKVDGERFQECVLLDHTLLSVVEL